MVRYPNKGIEGMMLAADFPSVTADGANDQQHWRLAMKFIFTKLASV